MIEQLKSVLHYIKTNLWSQVIVAMILGVIFGILIGPTTSIVQYETSELIAGWVAFPGKLFLLVIQFIIIPLIVASVIRGIAANENANGIGRLSSLTLSFFVITTLVSVIFGIAIAYTFHPGTYIQDTSFSYEASAELNVETPLAPEEILSLKKFPDLIIGLFPKDPLATFVSGNMLQTVISAIILGVALASMPLAKRRPILDLLDSIQSVCMVIVNWVMRFVPFAVFGLISNISARIGIHTLFVMGIYVLTVLIGLIILFGMYLLIISVITRSNIIDILRKAKTVLFLAFSTSSSAAVMPLTLNFTKSELKLKKNIVDFVIPLGATINMAGTALYQGVATIFLAQVFQIDLSISGLILIIIMSTGASIGSPGTPGIGIVILATILESVGIPASGIALIMGVDRILDMCRTTVNVIGDVAASVTIDYIMSDKNKSMPSLQSETPN